MALCKDLSCLLIFSTTTVFSQTGADSGPGSAIEVSDVVYFAETGKVSFSVLSLSSKPILAFGLKVSCKYSDDSTAAFAYTADYVPTLALTGKTLVGVRPGQNIGELQHGTRVTASFGVGKRGGSYPVDVSILPSFVIFSDNTVSGADEPSVSRLFSNWETSRDECAGFLESLRKIRSTSNLQAEVQMKADSLRRAANATSVFSRQTPNSHEGPCLLCAQFAREMEGLGRKLRAKKWTPEETISRYMEDVERNCAVYDAHAARTGGGR